MRNSRLLECNVVYVCFSQQSDGAGGSYVASLRGRSTLHLQYIRLTSPRFKRGNSILERVKVDGMRYTSTSNARPQEREQWRSPLLEVKSTCPSAIHTGFPSVQSSGVVLYVPV